MVIDFDKEQEKKIDYFVKAMSKHMGKKFTKGQLRTFVIDSIIKELDKITMWKLIVKRTKEK